MLKEEVPLGYKTQGCVKAATNGWGEAGEKKGDGKKWTKGDGLGEKLS